MLTGAQLVAICGPKFMTVERGDRVAAAIEEGAFSRWPITTKNSKRAFIAFTAEESGFYTATRENLRHSPVTLAANWKRFRGPDGAPNAAAIELATKTPQEIGEALYGCDSNPGARAMGNVEPGDGYDFRGGCWLQITWRATWQACAAAHGYDDLSRDELAGWADEAANDPVLNASCSAWFFTMYKPRILPFVATGDEGDFLRAGRECGVVGERAKGLWLTLWRKAGDVLPAEPVLT